MRLAARGVALLLLAVPDSHQGAHDGAANALASDVTTLGEMLPLAYVSVAAPKK